MWLRRRHGLRPGRTAERSTPTWPPSLTLKTLKSLNNLRLMHNINNRVWIRLYNNVQNWSSEFELDCPYNSVCAGVFHKGEWKLYPRDLKRLSVRRNESKTENYGFSTFLAQTTWKEAQHRLQMEFGRLATVKNQAERDYLAVNSADPVWLDPYGEGWCWSDGSNISFINWLDNQVEFLCSERRCAASLQTADGEGGWETHNCTEKFPFFCYCKLVNMQIVQVELEVGSGLDLNSAEIQEALLQYIKQRLKEKGMPVNTKLSWRKQADGQVFHKKRAEKRDSKKNKRNKKKDEF
ncbi:hypothetical protein ACEWY4_024869 [Coilia grayii]|uniref:C-type lectin domain-containing protein n=1 Tax=Coilia grayii TaxID=363190 RepID=A0ABD1IYN7_9TELE